MFGPMYRLAKATVAVLRNTDRQACRVLPEGSVVLVESVSDAAQKVNIRWGNQELWMFADDLGKRGILLFPADRTRTGPLKPPTPLLAGAEWR
jgi:hypothetical protein